MVDSLLWRRLLGLARREPDADDGEHGLYGALLGLRCWGAAILRSDKGHLRIRPRLFPEAKMDGWVSEAEYSADAAPALGAHAERLARFLAAIDDRRPKVPKAPGKAPAILAEEAAAVAELAAIAGEPGAQQGPLL